MADVTSSVLRPQASATVLTLTCAVAVSSGRRITAARTGRSRCSQVLLTAVWGRSAALIWSSFCLKAAREAPPQTAKLPADLVFPSSDADFEQATAGTRGHDRPTAAARCAEVRFAMRPAVPLQSGWSGHCLQGCGAGVSDATPPQNSGQVSKCAGLRSSRPLCTDTQEANAWFNPPADVSG